jgi:biopolymer transport protein ExbB
MLKDLTLWQAIKIGGPVMYLLFLCSIVSIAIILERAYFYFRRSRRVRSDFMKTVRDQFERGNLDKAVSLCKDAFTPYSAVVAAGLGSWRLGLKEAAEAMEREIVIETSDLEKWTAIVGTIGSTAVYIGLLGTVWGIIRAFRDIAQLGSGDINVIIHGISEALVCTAAGLFVAIPAVVAHNYFVKKINSFVTEMELCASETSSLLEEHKERQ